jgi:HK97 family phage major capsid protein
MGGERVLGDLGDIAFADFTQYTIGLRKEISLDKSNAPGWTEDMMDYRVILRLDGQGSWDKVLTPAHEDTQSPFITLAERA